MPRRSAEAELLSDLLEFGISTKRRRGERGAVHASTVTTVHTFHELEYSELKEGKKETRTEGPEQVHQRATGQHQSQ